MKTAVIYARYSCDNQTEQSIEGQLRVCEDYATRNNIVILNTYIDRAMTGTNDNRPDFQRMLKDSNEKTWDYVIVYKLDRFSRNKYETTIHKHTLAKNGVKVLSAMENIPDTPEGIILESLLEGMNQYYSAELSQKVKRGMKETRLKGYFQGGYLLYGYKLDGRKIVIDEDKVEIVEFIFKQFSLGFTAKSIITSLTARGILHNGKPFTTNSIYNILRNEKYLGVYKHNEEIIDNMYPQIISNELFNIVKKKIKINKKGKQSENVSFLLKDKLICGYCGHSINSENGTSHTGQRNYYYKCYGRKKRLTNCNKSIIKKETLENFIIETILSELKKPSNIENIVKGLYKFQQNQLKENNAIILLLKEQKQTQNTLNNLLNAVEQGIINKTTNQRMQELERKLEDIENQIIIENSKKQKFIEEDEIRKFYETALKSEPQMIINYFIKQIILYDDKIEICFNSPLKSSPDNQGFLFCKTFKEMGIQTHYKLSPIYKNIEVELYIK